VCVCDLLFTHPLELSVPSLCVCVTFVVLFLVFPWSRFFFIHVIPLDFVVG
jgi:hypothetical protein